MRKIFLLFFIFFLNIFFASCSHVNELAKYNLYNKKVLLKQVFNSNISDVNVVFNYNTYKNTLFEVLLEEIGSGYVESEVKLKLNRAINPDSISNSISNGLYEGLKTYYKIQFVNLIDSNPDYILESIFEKFSLKSDSYGVYAHISTRGRLINRSTAKLIWQNDETYVLPIGYTTYYYSGDRKITTTTGLINAARLIQMTEDEIRTSIEVVAKEVGLKQSEQLRYDISESK